MYFAVGHGLLVLLEEAPDLADRQVGELGGADAGAVGAGDVVAGPPGVGVVAGLDLGKDFGAVP
jgi:hypothetical protein